jgi:hypothetical protein
MATGVLHSVTADSFQLVPPSPILRAPEHFVEQLSKLLFQRDGRAPFTRHPYFRIDRQYRGRNRIRCHIYVSLFPGGIFKVASTYAPNDQVPPLLKFFSWRTPSGSLCRFRSPQFADGLCDSEASSQTFYLAPKPQTGKRAAVTAGEDQLEMVGLLAANHIRFDGPV